MILNSKKNINNIYLFSLLGCLAVLLSFSLFAINPTESQEAHYHIDTQKNFYDVMYDLRFAISDENFNITSINRVGEVIAERDRINYPHYTVISSCNLEIAKQFLDIDPKYIAYMPCRIAVWEQHQKTQVMAMLLPENDKRCGQLCIEMNQRLKKIINYAAK